jgi:hypothetical protein
MAAATFAGVLAGVYVLGSAGRGGLALAPPDLEGLRLRSDFESGTTEGWEGVVLSGGAAEGQSSLQVGLSATGRGLMTEAADLAFPAGERVEIGFCYFYGGEGPIAVEFEVAEGGLVLTHSIPDPVRGRWTPAVVRRESYADGQGRAAPMRGRTVRRLRISAPAGTASDALSLDSIWVWSGG